MTKVSFVRSAICSAKGLLDGILKERTIKIQLIISVLLISSAIILEIPKGYLITIIILCSLVIILELFNRSFEMLIDFISPEYNKKAGKIKDSIAGVVLASFFLAITVSFIILYEPVIRLIKKLLNNPLSEGLIIASIVLLGVIILLDYAKRN
jgi:diacylglycerol kinase (ATP)